MSRKTTAAIAGGWGSLLLLTALVGCGPSEQVKQQLAELQTVSAEKDSLMTEVAENAKLMSDISAEVARVETKPKTTAGAEAVPVTITRDSILSSIKDLTSRLDSTEARLARSQRRVRGLRGQTASMQKTIADLQATVENQKETIASLTEQVSNLQQQNVQLTAQNAALTDTVSNMTTRDNTVYYVVGTKDQLLKDGVVQEEGGSRVLFIFGKRGKVLVPSGDLNPSEFTAVDLRQVTDIPLPDSTKLYHIVSRQDASALPTPPDKDGYIKAGGSGLHITDPDKFWAGTKYLIIVQKS
jgi:cell division protein FtsB